VLRDRSFFFFDFEGTRIQKGTTHLTRVPTADERNGIFGSTITDPLTGQPFPNNAIPAARIDPVGLKLLSYFPLPNITGANNFIRQPNVVDQPDRYTGRLDLHLSNNDNVFGRYIYSNRFRFIPGDFGGIADGTSTSAWGRQFLKSRRRRTRRRSICRAVGRAASRIRRISPRGRGRAISTRDTGWSAPSWRSCRSVLARAGRKTVGRRRANDAVLVAHSLLIRNQPQRDYERAVQVSSLQNSKP
jgi:hypothetical protein